jgi:hypothetical protein
MLGTRCGQQAQQRCWKCTHSCCRLGNGSLMQSHAFCMYYSYGQPPMPLIQWTTVPLCFALPLHFYSRLLAMRSLALLRHPAASKHHSYVHATSLLFAVCIEGAFESDGRIT